MSKLWSRNDFYNVYLFFQLQFNLKYLADKKKFKASQMTNSTRTYITAALQEKLRRLQHQISLDLKFMTPPGQREQGL